MPIQRRRLTEDRGRRRRPARSATNGAINGARGTRPAGSGRLGAAANTSPAQSGRLDAARPAAAATAAATTPAATTSGSGSGPAAAATATSAAAAAAAAVDDDDDDDDRRGGAGSGCELAPAREVGGPRPCRCGARMHYCIYIYFASRRAHCVHTAQTLRMHCTGAAVPLRCRYCRCYVSPRRSPDAHPNAHPDAHPNAHPTPSRCICWSNVSQRVG
jgi:hypothetical protein